MKIQKGSEKFANVPVGTVFLFNEGAFVRIEPYDDTKALNLTLNRVCVFVGDEKVMPVEAKLVLE